MIIVVLINGQPGGGPGFGHSILSIHQRSFDPGDRSQAGHWQGDIIVGKNQGSAIGMLVERQTRLVRLVHLLSRDADSFGAFYHDDQAGLPGTLIHLIIWDQGSQMARHTDSTADLGALVYFWDSRSPGQFRRQAMESGYLRFGYPP